MAKVAVENDEQPSRCIVSSLNLLSFLAVIFALVLALHCDVLTVPPAIEQARGLWLQAAYLADSDFDFAGLQNEPASGEVSAYNYQAWKTSLPTLLALLMKALPTTQSVIVAYRSLTFLGAALIAVLVHSVVRPFTGRWLSILLVVCLLTNRRSQFRPKCWAWRFRLRCAAWQQLGASLAEAMSQLSPSACWRSLLR